MTPPTTSAHNFIAKCLLFLLLIAFHVITTRADTTDGSTPLALQPGTPAGSYALSNFDNINPYNGALNFGLPLLNIGGRGTAGYTMTLPLEQKWRINVFEINLIVYAEGGGPPLPDPQTTRHYFPSANWWAGLKPGYGPGVLQGRVAQFDAQVCPDSTMRAAMMLTRLTFTAADGTEFELRDKQTDGTAAVVGICDAAGLNRGKLFVTADGSAATFISDQPIVDYIMVPNGGNDLFYPSGDLLMRDGTRYRIDAGVVSWLRDRNGNKMTFNYDSFQRMTVAKDSLNREVTVTYSTTSIPYDEIIYKGFGGAQRTLRVNYAQLGDPGSLRSDYSSPQTYNQLFPIEGSSGTGTYNPKVVRSVALPNNQQYQFQYNPYGELARVVLPTGGAFEYDHSGGFGGGDANGILSGNDDLHVYRRVITKRVYDNGTTMTSKLTFSGQTLISGNTNYCLIEQFASDGSTRLNQKKIYYEGFAENSFFLLPTDYSPWKDGREFQSDSVAADGTTVLQRVARTWQQPVAGSSWPLTQPETNAAAKPNSPQTTQVITTLEPSQANKVSKQTFAYDKYTNRTDVEEFDFGTGAPSSSPVRRTHTDYLTSSYDTLNPSSSNPDLNLTSHIRNLPTQTSVFDANNVERARAAIEYDNYALDGPDCLQSFHCPLLPRANISGLDSSFTAGYTKRGNPTAVTRYLLSGGTGSVSTYSHYDIAGNAVRSIDPRSTTANIIATTIEYDDRFGAPNNEAQSNTAPTQLAGLTSFAFPTKVINSLGHTAYAQFDYHLGKPVNGEDANQVVASGTFNDVLDRPTQIRRGVGTSAENQTTFGYDDGLRIVTTTSDLHATDDNVLLSKIFYDQMGRTKETQQYEGGGNYIAVQTEYDSLGRPFKTSNPFRPWQSQTAVWTTQVFDALGRVISVMTPDNAVLSTSYSGNAVTVTDQAGKKRKSVTDALGRLFEIYEDPNGVNYQTTYVYDVLDNLVKVTQGSQQRFFMYDSLKRLIRARNPEQSTLSNLALSDPISGNSAWSIAYEYDSSGNLIKKTDTRGVESIYTYDALNRNTTINYTDTPIAIDVKWFYDGATNGKGRFWHFYKGGDFSTGQEVEHTSVDSYDALGRPLVQRQLFKSGGVWSTPYQVERTYNSGGGVTSQKYPSQHSVTYNYDQAGRVADNGSNLAFKGNLGGAERTYAAGITYSQWGSLSREQYGTNTAVYNKLRYNTRGQLCDVRASNSGDEWGGELGALVNHYSTTWQHCGSGTDNNGNVLMSQTIINSYLMEDRYSYDALNRLTAVDEWQNGSTHTGSQQYDYDRWGNRTIKPASWGIGINTKQFTVDTATNRLAVPGGQSGVMTYDFAGNLTNDTYTGAGLREYDAENRMTRAWGGNNQSQYYIYNANGQRVRRKVDNQETWQIYGFDGELLAEYVANGPAASPQKEYGYRNGQLLVTAENNSPPGGPPTSGLVGYWRFDENSGTTATDSSGAGHTGTLTNGPTWSTGQAGAALTFDGADDLVSNNGITDVTNNFTISFWAQPTATHELDGENTAGASGTSGQRYALWPAWNNNGHAGAGVSVGTNGVSVYEHADGYMPATLVYAGSLSGWTHVAIVYENKQPKLYLNGSLVRTGLTSPMSFVHLNPAFIGGQVYGYYAGKLDELRIYNRALSASEVATLPSNSQAYTAASDFSNTQGFRNWYYVDENNSLLSYDAVNNVWVGSEGPYQWLWATGGHPGAAHDVVRQWRAPEAGSIQISGSVADGDAGGGDGVLITIKKGGQTLWQQTLANGNSTGLSYDLTTTVQAADQISFSINRNGSPSWDATNFNPTITFTPTSVGAGSQLHWLVTDHLGTPRMIIDQTGALANVKRHDYLPFGEELFAPTGGRSTALGYTGGDGVRQQFTQKERDVETGLDYFLARYYSSTQGRFTSPDEFKGGPQELFANVDPHDPLFYSDIAEPQSINKYNYVLNNPLKFVDPDGHQATIADRLKAGASSVKNTALNTLEGAASAFAEDNGLGGTTGPQNSVGRGIGHGLAVAQGTLELAGGITIAAGGGAEAIVTSPAAATVVGSAAPLAGVVVAAAGAGVAIHGGAVLINTASNIFRGTKEGGSITEPNAAPTGTIVKQDGVTVTRYTGDHAPPHFHVDGKGPSTKIGQNGKPLRNLAELSAKQRQVVQKNLRTIRKAMERVMKEWSYNQK